MTIFDAASFGGSAAHQPNSQVFYGTYSLETGQWTNSSAPFFASATIVGDASSTGSRLTLHGEVEFGRGEVTATDLTPVAATPSAMLFSSQQLTALYPSLGYVAVSAAPLAAAPSFGSQPSFDPNAFNGGEAVCYAPGTLLETARGPVAVEALRPDDLLRCVAPRPCLRPVVWLGQQRQHPLNAGQWPVRIRAGAFASGLPRRDLVVSPGHSLAADGRLVRATLLVNGASILREYRPVITWHHVELDAHAVVLAEGLPAESYLDTGNRALFGLAGVAAPDATCTERFAAAACLPVLEAGPALAAIQARLLARAEACFGLQMMADPAPRLLLANGSSLGPDANGGFTLPAGAWLQGPVRLASRSCVPAELLPGQPDPRRLGLCLAALELDDGVSRRIVAATDAVWDQAGGMHRVEHGDDQAWRWTDGEAHLPAQLFSQASPARRLRLTPRYAHALPRYRTVA